MNWLEESLVMLLLIVLALFFSNLWAVQSDRQAEIEHQKIRQYKTELKLNQNKEN